jgi:hypothetical protein
MYSWLVFIHLLGVFGFLMSHGVAAFVAFRVRTEKDLTALRALLALSGRSGITMFISLLVLLAGGISAAIVGHISRNWPFAALVVLIVVSGLMSAFTGRQFRKIRVAAGFTGGIKVTGEAKPEELAASQVAFNPWVSAVTGGAGLAIILWLMVLKPF